MYCTDRLKCTGRQDVLYQDVLYRKRDRYSTSYKPRHSGTQVPECLGLYLSAPE
jgi:hypothetical protein